MVIIPIGIDCEVAEVLKKINIRTVAYPFDWNVTYCGVNEIIKNNFKDFVPTTRYGIQKNPKYSTVFNKYGTMFIHEDWIKDEKNEQNKYYRRIERFQKLLNDSNETIYFIRKGHMFHHHTEYYFQDDMESVTDLSNFLRQSYPKLTFKIILTICCPSCYNDDIPLIEDPNIVVFKNIRDIPINLYHCMIQEILPYIDKNEINLPQKQV